MRPTVEDEMDEDFDAEEENKLINEEYKVWKKNSPYLYDLVIAHALDWPSLTCQWFPDSESPAGKSYTTHRVLLGTHTSGQSADYLQIATVQIPKRSGPGSDVLDRTSYDDTTGELGGHTLSAAHKRVQITQRICHEGEINRARYMPQNPDLIATKTVTGEVFVFDRTKHGSEPDRDGKCKPDIKLVGQTQEGYGIAWNPQKAGHILSSSNDHTVAHWDINAYAGKANNRIEPLNIYKGHAASVGDVDWHATKENVFASVGDDKMLMIWDTRTPTDPSVKNQAHDADILSVAFSPASEHILITGSADNTIALHDLRNPMRRLHTFESHTSDVLHLSWSPHEPTIFASAAGDRRINIWDLSLIGAEQSPDDAEDGAPELLFVHGGHTAKPADFGWAPGVGERWTAVSTSEDNVLMVWTPTARVWASEEVRVEERELEDGAMEVEDEGVAKVEED